MSDYIEFDEEGVFRYLMTNFDVDEEDNRAGGAAVVFSSYGTAGQDRDFRPRVARRLSHVLPDDMTILHQLYNACLAVIYKRRQRAAVFIAHFIKHSGYAVKQFSFREDLQELVLQAVMEVAARKESFNLLTRELVLQTCLEYPMFTHAQRKRLMERLATMCGEAIWSSSDSFLNWPVKSFENDKTSYVASKSDLFTFTPEECTDEEPSPDGHKGQTHTKVTGNPLTSNDGNEVTCDKSLTSTDEIEKQSVTAQTTDDTS
ncbi:uncharacterized protein [Apostichopus japonicus]|uniref:uncharacterized protein isoform X1 n=1 Tax=Stichopus japonicus TaxID=307972 RepID=UPI003AB86073